MPGIAGISGQCFLNAFFDCFDGEMTADRFPAIGLKCLEDDVGVGEDSCFLHTVRTSQLKRCCEVVLSKELGQTAQAKTHGFGSFTRRQTPVF